MSHTIARNEGVEGDVQIMRMHYETAGFDLTGRGRLSPKIARCTLRELITQMGRFHGLNEILHDERYE
jgi:hypothetical protein